MTTTSNKSNKSNKKFESQFFVTKNQSEKIKQSKPLKLSDNFDSERQLIFESYLCNLSELSLPATLDCGQCFRWRRDNSVNELISYNGIVRGLPIRVWNAGDSVWARGCGTVEFWRNYFDLDRDYNAILSSVGFHPFTQAAIEYGRGLRVLRQDAWEMLGSYIISQNNNIPKICSSILKICVLCGERIEFDGLEFYSFPSADKILALDESELRRAGLGYRSEYLFSAARAMVESEINLDEMRNLSTIEAREKLLSLRGVGPKVANCVLLFGLGKLDAFPIDTWISKAAKYYDNKLDGTKFGKYAGIIQEYIFYYIRNLKEK
ncbi:MAG: hypothetical protein LBB88_04200 [Planctomycetaceae bacterium]|jgi:N-glycosylase/DNA lyase|nr:hypothetical protein [Planctomycetaceae bacterium]